MKIVAQRVRNARVIVDDRTVGEIGEGLVLLIGIRTGDTPEQAEYLANKCVHLRVFEDEAGVMNRSLLDVGGEVLAISQFTLYGNTEKGRRPSYIDAARPEEAEKLYDDFVEKLRAQDLKVETGIFGAMMMVEIHNWGPVTILLER